MSTQRHLDKLRTPVDRHPRHRRDAGVPAAEPRLRRRREGRGMPAELVVAQHYNHFEMGESLGNPYGPNGRAALAMMKLA